MTVYNQFTPQTEEEIFQAQLQQALKTQSTPEYRKLIELEELILRLKREIRALKDVVEKIRAS